MKLKITIIAVLLSALGVSAHAQTYFSGNIGLGMLESSDLTEESEPETVTIGFDNSIILSGAIGYVINNFRTELEIAYQKNDIDTFGAGGFEIDSSDIDGFDGELSSLTGLINGYYDFDLGTAFRPYLTAGLGLAKIDFDLDIDSDILDEPISESADDSVLAYHLGAGFGYAVSENVILDLRYRFLMTADPDFDGVKADYNSHNITGGIRINF